MHAAILTAILVMPVGATPAKASGLITNVSATSLSSVADDFASQLETGSLLFSQGDCLAIRVYTASRYTHVAMVCVESGQPMVYDSMNGVGVRRLTLADYLGAESPNRVHLFQPQQSLTAEQGGQLKDYLDSQRGRPYAILHHVTGERVEGLHCAEYATDAMMSIGLIHAKRPAKVSPASLATGITQSDIYTAGPTLDLAPPEKPRPIASNGCHQLWLDTQRCTRDCCDKLTGWFLCR